MVARRVGFSDSTESPKGDTKTRLRKAVVRFALIEFLGIIALAAAMIYLYSDFWQIFGAEPHLLSDGAVVNVSILAVGAFISLVVLLFVFILLPVLKEAKNAR